MAPLHIPNEFWITVSYICFVLCAIPFWWHLEAWNSATCIYMFWAGLSNLNQAINATVYNGNAINRAPICCLCINRRLYLISSLRIVNLTKAEKRRAVLVDLAISVGIPIILMALTYIVQGHRFDIFEDVGCQPAIYITPVALVLCYVPPVIIGLVSGSYSILSIRAFANRRSELKKFLSESRGSVSPNRYLRLMMMAGIETSLTVPFCLWDLCGSIVDGVAPWKGWADTHFNFSRVDQIPAIIWRASPVSVRALEIDRFLPCLCAITFFAFFGFAEEARDHYRLAFQFVAKHMVNAAASIVSFGSFKSNSNGTVNALASKDSLPVVIKRGVMGETDFVGTFPHGSVNNAISPVDERHAPLAKEFSHNVLKLTDVGRTMPDVEFPIHPSPAAKVSPACALKAIGACDLTLPEPAIISQSEAEGFKFCV